MLNGKTALITGASRGIGRAIARSFAANHASINLCARSAGIMDLAKELGQEFGVEATAHVGDIRDSAFLKETILHCKKTSGHIDTLVNNAGVIQQGLVGMIPLDQTRETLEVNVVALINITQLAVRLMGPNSSIINIASIAGTRGMEGTAAYSASKGGVVAFTLSIAKELAKKGIRANAIAPGFIDTDMTRGLTPDWFQKRVDSIAMGRIGTPEDIAGTALFLASDLSSYVTGQIIGVDGGMVS
jgi:3-oxoacyl-[acyl-carrier protein] reductase